MDRLAVAAEADRLLRAKFGSLLTSWSPNEGNYLFLDLEDPFFKELLRESQEQGFDIYGVAQEGKVFINRELNLEYRRHLKTAIHEMIHIHSLVRSLDLGFSDPIWEGITKDEYDKTSQAALEIIADYLAFKTMQEGGPIGFWPRLISLLREPELHHPGTEMERICQKDLWQIFSPLGEEWDRTLFLWLLGAPCTAWGTKFESIYGKDSFTSLIALLVAQTRLLFPGGKGILDPELLQIYEAYMGTFTKRSPKIL